jgi:two-component system, NarL family, nitrate/nitrite response regulator NarL
MRTLIVSGFPIVAAGLQVIVHRRDPQHEFCVAGDVAELDTALKQDRAVTGVILDITDSPQRHLATLRALHAQHSGLRLATSSATPVSSEAWAGFASSRDVVAIAHFNITDRESSLLESADRFLANNPNPVDVGNTWASSPIEAKAGARLDLTRRQIEVLDQLMRGHGNKKIALNLGISASTVKVHVSNILRALGASSRTCAVLAAAEHGFEIPADAKPRPRLAPLVTRTYPVVRNHWPAGSVLMR